MSSRPLTVREGRASPGGPYEGVPEHLRGPLQHWLERTYRYVPNGAGRVDDEALLMVAAGLRIPLTAGSSGNHLFLEVSSHCSHDDERMLDFIHATVQLADRPHIGTLQDILMHGGSVWTAGFQGLTRVVDPTATAAYDQATDVDDQISDDLVEAWVNAYGRHPDPADAWDHAIKAVEAALRPIVCPNNPKATLSNVIGDLRSQGHLWQLKLRGRARDHSVAPLVQMLELIWTDPNRHGSATPEAPAMLEEARAVVHLAVTIVQWGRNGLIARK